MKIRTRATSSILLPETVVLFGVTTIGTANSFLVPQLKSMAERQWRVHLACSYGLDGIDPKNLRDHPEFTTHRIFMRRNPSLKQDVRSFISWIRLILEIKPDAVVLSTPKAALLGMLASWMCSVPLRVYHVRGLRVEGMKGVWALLGQLFEGLTAFLATDVLVDSESLLKEMRRRHLLNGERGTVLGCGSCCGVDTNWFHPPSEDEKRRIRALLDLTGEDIVIGFVGRITTDKGIRELLAAVAQAHAANHRVRLLMVGPLEDPALESVIGAAAQQSWVRMSGVTQDPRSFLWAIDVFVLASYREGFPIAPLEAQSCGVPVITTTATGCVDSIVPNITGLLVAPRNSEQLAMAINQLIANPELRTQMGRDGRLHVESHFKSEMVVERVSQQLEQWFRNRLRSP